MGGNTGPDRERSDPLGPHFDASRRSSLVTAREAAAILGVNERTVRRAIARGDLPATKRGRGFQITPDAIARFRGRRESRSERHQTWQPTTAPANLSMLSVVRSRTAWERQQTPALPTPLTGFIGREQEVTAIAQRLRREDARLVTLTGAGGVGKTRLALRVAEEIASDFADGVVFVSLAEIRHSSFVLPAIARAVGVRESPERSLDVALQVALRGRALLLILDNFEHLQDQGTVADLANLLRTCRRLVVLVTSRAPLRMSGEHRFVVPPLALPNAAEAIDETRLAEYEAIALFVERARLVHPDFLSGGGNAAVVVEICRRLDGLPLAIELAAAHMHALTPEALLGRLSPRLPLLTGGGLDQPARLRTMRDAIAWSYDLLSTEEQGLFRRLAVFVGGFTIEAAEAVVETASPPEAKSAPRPEGAGRGARPSVLEVLIALGDKSLIQPMGPGAAEPRFTMLETVREFALEELATSGEDVETREAHAAHCLALAEAAANAAERVGSGEWLRRLATERSNLRAALDWLEQSGGADAALQMSGALWHYWYRLGDMAEGRTRLERALAVTSPEAGLVFRARALRGAGVLAWQSADFERSRERLEAALADYRALGDRAGSAWALNSLGCLSATLSDQERAAASFTEALAIFRELDDAVGVAQLTVNLGELAESNGQHDLAIERLEAGLAWWRALDDRVGAARAQVVLTHALLARDDVARAEAVLRDALTTIRDNDYEQILPAALRAAAQLAARRGDGAAAARWYGAEDRVRETLGVAAPAVGRDGHERTMAAVRDTLGKRAFATAWASGRGLSAAQVIAEVLADGGTDSGESSALSASGLSPRERDVLGLLAAGRSDKQIADALFITRRTASKHVSAILAKLGVPSRAAAVAIAVRTDLP